MCDLCCTRLFIVRHQVGETQICSRCWRRYFQLIRDHIGRDAGHRLFIIREAHCSSCDECDRLKPVEWTDRRGVAYQATDHELDVALLVA